MMTAEQEIADALCELKTIRADYRAMSEAWRRDKRAIIDICVAHADIRTLQAILDHLEKSCDWTRWPAEPPGLRAGAVAWAIGLRECIAREANRSGDAKTLFHALDLLEHLIPIATGRVDAFMTFCAELETEGDGWKARRRADWT